MTLPPVMDASPVLAALEADAGANAEFVLDLDVARVVWANRSALRLLGVPEPAALGAFDLTEHCAAAALERVCRRCRRIEAGETARVNLVIYSASDDIGSLWRCRASPVELRSGSRCAYLRMLDPREERRKGPVSMTASHRALLTALLEESPIEFGLKDATGRYVLMSEYAAGLIGLTSEETIGLTANDFFASDCANQVTAMDRRTVELEHIEQSEVSPGPEFANRNFYAIKFPVRDEHGEPFGAGAVATDVTRLKNAERALARSQETVRDAHSSLVAGIAHHFNNILAQVLGFAELAQTVHGARRDDYIAEVISGAGHARDIVKQLLAYTRVQSSSPARVDLPPHLDRAIAGLGERLAGMVQLEGPPPDRVMVVIDPHELDEVLGNLLANADESNRADRPIRVHVEAPTRRVGVCSACLQSFDFLAAGVAVADQGEGIAAEDVPRIFDPFYTSRGHGVGRGLGLSVVHGFVHQAGGHVVVESRVGLGTTVTVLVPSVPDGS